MREEEAKALLLKVVEKQPAVIFDIVDVGVERRRAGRAAGAEGGGAGAEGGGAGAEGGGDGPEWCTCHQCQDMPTDLERKCCGGGPRSCLSRLPVSDTSCKHLLFYSFRLHTSHVLLSLLMLTIT